MKSTTSVEMKLKEHVTKWGDGYKAVAEKQNI